MSTAIQTQEQRYSELAPAEEVRELQAIMAKMSAAGWAIAENGSSRQPSAAERFAVAMMARKYDLDPVLGEVYLLGTRLYVAYQAVERRIAEREDVEVSARPATDEERALHRVDDLEEFWIAEVRKRRSDGTFATFTGYGYASTDDVGLTRQRSVTPLSAKRLVRNVAEKRAKERACRAAIGLGAQEPDGAIDIGTVTATASPAGPLGDVLAKARAAAPQITRQPDPTPPPVDITPAAAEPPVNARVATLQQWAEKEGAAMKPWLRELWASALAYADAGGDDDAAQVIMGAVKGRKTPDALMYTGAIVDMLDATGEVLAPSWWAAAWAQTVLANGEVARVSDAWGAIEDEDAIERMLGRIAAAKPQDRADIIRALPREPGAEG